jgi:hypothetical protein
MAISPNPTVSAVVTGNPVSHIASARPGSSNSNAARQPQKPQPQFNNTQTPQDTVNISPNAISAVQQSRQTPSQAIEQIDRAVSKAPNI